MTIAEDMQFLGFNLLIKNEAHQSVYVTIWGFHIALRYLPSSAAVGFHVRSGLFPQILDLQAIHFEPLYSLLAVLQQYGTPESCLLI